MHATRCPSRSAGLLRLLGAMIVCVGFTLPVIAKEPVPSVNQLGRQRRAVERLYADRIANATTPAARRAMAEQLVGDAEGADAGSVEQYALLDVALEQAVKAPAPGVAMRALDAMSESFRFDAPSRWTDTLRRCLRAASEEGMLIDLARTALDRTDGAIEVSRFNAARELTFIASAAARRVGVNALKRRATRLRNRVKRLRRVYREIEPARRILKNDPSNPPANLEVGRFLCFFKGDWNRGLKLLARGNDDDLAQLAERELAEPEAAAELAAIADAWWAEAGRHEAIAAEQIRHHATKWYERAIGELSGLAGVRARKRLQQVPPRETAERYKTFRWQRRAKPVRLIHRGRGFAFLSQMRGKYMTPSAELGVRLTPAGDWELNGDVKDNVRAQAMSIIPPDWDEMNVEIEKHVWELGDEPMKMLRAGAGFCVLGGVGGKFRGNAERVRIRLSEDGYWHLNGHGDQEGVRAWAYSIDTGGRGLNGRNIRRYRWDKGDEPIRMIHSAKGFCFLSGLGGWFAGNGSEVRVYIGEDGYWYLHGRSNWDSLRAHAIAIYY